MLVISTRSDTIAPHPIRVARLLSPFGPWPHDTPVTEAMIWPGLDRLSQQPGVAKAAIDFAFPGKINVAQRVKSRQVRENLPRQVKANNARIVVGT